MPPHKFLIDFKEGLVKKLKKSSLSSFVLLFVSLVPTKQNKSKPMIFALGNARMIIAGLFATSYDSVCSRRECQGV